MLWEHLSVIFRVKQSISWTASPYGGNKLLNRIYELVRQIWEEERIPEERKETIIVLYTREKTEIGVRITGE